MKFKPNRNLARTIGLSEPVALLMKNTAEVGAAIARDIGPVGDSADGEHYVDKISSTVVRGRTRWIGRITASKFTSVWLEFGTARTRAFAPLRRALDALRNRP